MIKVLANRAIGCDDPKRDDLKYQVRLHDGVFETFGEISISITDINNKAPELGPFASVISIYENATSGTFITKVNATDLDRDGEIFKTTLNV